MNIVGHAPGIRYNSRMVTHKNCFYENSTTFVILIMHKDSHNYLYYKSGLYPLLMLTRPMVLLLSVLDR